MYSKSYSYIKIGNNLTSRFQNNLGVRQGDNLSANLFKIYLNDLPKYLSESAHNVYLNDSTNHIHCLMYADDMVILSSTAEGLQHKLDILEGFCNDWCLKVNTNKIKSNIPKCAYGPYCKLIPI